VSTPGQPVDARALVQQAIEALRKGDPATARDRFQQVIASGVADASVWLGLALALRGTNDKEGSLVAIEQALKLEPRNIRARVMKADHYAELGDARAASAFYASVVRAAPPPEQLPPELRNEVARAEVMSRRYAADYEVFLRDRLSGLAFADDSAFAQSLDLMLGKKQIYLQQPKHFYFPGLPQTQFYDRAQFPWLDAVEAATDAIRAELLDHDRHPDAQGHRGLAGRQHLADLRADRRLLRPASAGSARHRRRRRGARHPRRRPAGQRPADPRRAGQGQNDDAYRMHAVVSRHAELLKVHKAPPKYTPVSRRQDRPDAIMWFVTQPPGGDRRPDRQACSAPPSRPSRACATARTGTAPTSSRSTR
jgi:tetratricopeptide (TPR) repeat protein